MVDGRALRARRAAKNQASRRRAWGRHYAGACGIAALVISIVILTACSHKTMDLPNKTPAEIESEVHQAFLGLVEASKALDADRYFAYFDQEKFTGLNVDGTVWRSMNDFKALVAPGFATVKSINSLEFSKVKVTEINPTTAILINEFKQSFELKNGEVVEQAGAGTQVWSKTSGVWKLVSVSASDKPKVEK